MIFLLSIVNPSDESFHRKISPISMSSNCRDNIIMLRNRKSGWHTVLAIFIENKKKQVRIHDWTVACDWAGAVMPENHEKSEVISDGPTHRHNEL